MPVTTDDYPASAIVHLSGAVDECDGAAGRRLLETDPRLVAYGVALLGCDVDQARFLWHHTGTGWMRVRIERWPGPSGEASALFTLVRELLPFGLTDRELDVLTLLAGGFHNREIAQWLRASARTVSTHVEHILMKLGQRSRAGAAALAVDRGLLHLPLPPGGLGMDALSVGALERSVRGSRGDLRPRTVLQRRPFLIGSAIPLTGPAWSDGLEMRNGASLAIDEVNARGGIASRRIEHEIGRASCRERV